MNPWFNSDGTRRKGVVPPTRLRSLVSVESHPAPQSGVDHTGAPWIGASRVIDRPARRRAQRLSWRRQQAAHARKERRHRAVLQAIAEAA